MPAALPASNTARFKLRYNDGHNDHAMIMRSNSASASIASGVLGDFIAAHEDFIGLITINGLEYAPVGSDIFNPVTWFGEATYGAGGQPLIDRPFTYSYTGRSVGGHKVRVFLYGLDVPGADNWRIASLTGNFVEAALTALTEDSAFFRAIDGLVPVWNQYANQGANDHWIKKSRSG